MNELAEECEGKFNCLGETIHNLFSSNRKRSYEN